MSMFRTVFILLAAVVLTGCAASSTTATTNQLRDDLLRRDREWSAAAAAGSDVVRILSFWSEDAQVIPPGLPVLRGKPAIEAYVRQSLAIPGFTISWVPEAATVSADGTLGYTTGENAVTVPGSDGKLMTIKGRYAATWRRGPGGDWLCVIDIWNSQSQ